MNAGILVFGEVKSCHATVSPIRHSPLPNFGWALNLRFTINPPSLRYGATSDLRVDRRVECAGGGVFFCFVLVCFGLLIGGIDGQELPGWRTGRK